jgi:tRNA pseudouridine13 synthase
MILSCTAWRALIKPLTGHPPPGDSESQVSYHISFSLQRRRTTLSKENQVELPYATSGYAGCAGRLRAEHADFQVEEIPAYLPSGDGEHLYLLLEKRGISTVNLRSAICGAFRLKDSQVGHAGLKDSNALTRQWISVHVTEDLPLERLENANISLIEVSRHGNKLRPGHLKGNRFRITLRDISLPDTFAALLQRLESEGFPNYYGEQRFGVKGDNAARGRALLRSTGKPRMAREKARFLVNAYQSALFNRLLGRRINELGSISQMLPGDLAMFSASASIFPVLSEELEQAQQRATDGEIGPSACLFGYKAPLAQGLAGQWERELLESEGLQQDSFKKERKSLSYKGERRAVRALPEHLEWESLDLEGLPCLHLAFTLKPGVYATSFLREVMKHEPSAEYAAFSQSNAATKHSNASTGPHDAA